MAEWKQATGGNTDLPETWSPKEIGDTLEGIYQFKKEGVGINKSTTYEVKTKEGKIYSFWGSKVIDSKFNSEEDPILIGEEVKLIYEGERKGKGPRPYKVFTIYHRVVEKSEEEKIFAS